MKAKTKDQLTVRIASSAAAAPSAVAGRRAAAARPAPRPPLFHRSAAARRRPLTPLPPPIPLLQCLNGFLAKSDGKDKLTALIQARPQFWSGRAVQPGGRNVHRAPRAPARAPSPRRRGSARSRGLAHLRPRGPAWRPPAASAARKLGRTVCGRR